MLSVSKIVTKTEAMFDLFNHHFYNDELTRPAITVSPDGGRGAYGWCSVYEIWQASGEAYREINICAEYIDRPIGEVAATMLHEMAHLYNLTHEIKDVSNNGYYHNKKFKETAEYYSTVFHELIHSTGHAKRLNRIAGTAFFGSEAYSKEELVAEIGASALVHAAGLEPPDSGVIVHNGQDITYLKPNKRGFSIVFQDYALFPHLNLYDNIAYGLKLQKLSHDEIKKRVMPTLELLRLKEAVKKLPSQLSGGMQQRAAIARSLVLGNDLLLLDEPFSALDAVVKVDLGDELKELQRRFGITMIMVTHDQEEAFSLSDRVIVMQKGHIAAFDTPEELYLNRSGDEFIKSFITDQINKRARYVRKLIGGAGHEED